MGTSLSICKSQGCHLKSEERHWMLKMVFHFLPFSWLMITSDSNRIHYFLLHSILSILAQKKKKFQLPAFFKKKKLFEPQKSSLFYCLYCCCHLLDIHAISFLYKGELIEETRRDENLNHCLTVSGIFVPKSVLYLIYK